MNALPSTAPAAPTESILKKWVVEDREVSLLRQQDKLLFSVHAGGAEIKRGDIPLKLYDIDRAIELVNLFDRVIGENLRNGPVTPSAFLPVVCTDALRLQNRSLISDRNVKVALFGRVNDINGDIIDIRFGVFNPSDRSIYSCGVTEEAETTRQFLLNAPRYNRPHADETSPHHYAMNSYAKRFRPVIACSSAGSIQSVAMQRVSLINRDVVIDEKNWAITLLSATGSSALSGVVLSSGHAMIACEGVKRDDRGEERPFLLYAHITTLDKERGVPDPHRSSNQARVEILEETAPRLGGYRYGPTWVQSKDRVEEMLQFIREAEATHQYVTFGRVGDVSSHFIADMERRPVTAEERARSPIKAAIRGWLQDVSKAAFRAGASLETISKGSLGLNCKDWCVEQLKRGDIHLNIPPDLFTPNAFIERLNADPSMRVFGAGAARSR